MPEHEGMETVVACVAPKHCPSCSPLLGLFWVELLGLVEFAAFCLLSYWEHPPHLALPPVAVPSSSHPLPRAFPSCSLTAVLNIMIIKI